MLTLIKLVAGAAIALGILSPGFTPKADTCECKAKGNMSQSGCRTRTLASAKPKRTSLLRGEATASRRPVL